MKLLFSFLLLIFSTNLYAQKLSFDLNVGIMKAIGKKKWATHHYEKNTYTTLYYLSREKFKNPYFKILGHVSYPLGEKVSIGIQSGCYIHFRGKVF